jgi:nucleotide-binding universal stress UspA family protein
VVVRGEQSAVERRHRRLVLGLGDTAHPQALSFAFAYAAAWEARLDVVHAWRADEADQALGRPSGTAHPDAAGGPAHQWLASSVAEAAAAHPRVHTTLVPVARQTAAVALLKAAAEADLLVVGAHGRRAAGWYLGSVAHAVVHHAPCPVAVVPALAVSQAADTHDQGAA